MSGMKTNIQLTHSDLHINSIPEGCICTPTIVDGKKEGPADVLTSDSLLFAVLQYHNDKLNGVCEFFDNGILKEKITYKDGKPEGWGCIYENSEESKWFTYQNGKKISELTAKEGFRIEKSISNGNILSVCKYNQNHNRDGIGYIYSHNELSKAIQYEDGEEIGVVKTFSGKEMTELTKNGDKLYVGEFLNSQEKHYPRDGEGKEFEDGKIVYKGSWKNNMKEGKGSSYKNSRALYVGEWSKNVPEGKGCLYDGNGKVLHEGKWKKGVLMSKKGMIVYSSGGIKKKATLNKEKLRKLKKKMDTKEGKRVLGLLIALAIALIGWLVIYGIFEWLITYTVETREDLINLNKSAKRLKIPSNSCNDEDFTEFHLSEFPKLKSIVVGENACKNVKSVVLSGLDKLERVEFGMNSFTQATNSYGKNSSRSFRISSCNKLKWVQFGRFSFSDFGTFSLEDLDTLESVEFGSVIKESYNFHYASLELTSIFNMFSE